MPAWADVPQALDAYVRARAADAAGDSMAAAAGYRAALQRDPDSGVIANRAYREALVAGDMALARSAAATLDRAGTTPVDAALLDVASAVRDRQWAAADAAADRLSTGPLDFLAPVVKAWTAYARKADAPASLLPAVAKNPLAQRFNTENRALLLIADGQADAGVAQLRALVAAGSDSVNLRVAAAQLLAARGRRDAAQALLAGDDPAMAAVRDRIGRGVKPSAAFGISRLFVRLAADLVDGDARPLAIILCRTALEIDPDDDRARLTLAGALSNGGAQDRALALLGAVDPRGGYAATARGMSITMLTRAGQPAAALKVAEAEAAARAAGADDAQRLGDLLAVAGRYDDSAAAYALAMARGGGADDWMLNMQRGGALEQAGRWDEALPFLRRAVDLAPDQPHALNYLGYAQIERGENIDAARALLERALVLAPDDAAITDSLGWAYVRSGRVAQAVPLLERAARADPGDVTINEHLGDAYWALGRRYEARYAWRAAAVYADGKDAMRLAAKLADGGAEPTR
ncbi:MAG: tetratricopeptide repeat protein [Pseudomonadota bacterium]